MHFHQIKLVDQPILSSSSHQNNLRKFLWFHLHELISYRKFPKYSDTQKICCDYSKIWTMWLYHRVNSPNDADGMANSVDPDQTAPLGAVWSGSALFAQAYLSENLGSLRYFILMSHWEFMVHIIFHSYPFKSNLQNEGNWSTQRNTWRLHQDAKVALLNWLRYSTAKTKGWVNSFLKYLSRVMRKRVLCHIQTTRCWSACAVWSAPLVFAT